MLLLPPEVVKETQEPVGLPRVGGSSSARVLPSYLQHTGVAGWRVLLAFTAKLYFIFIFLKPSPHPSPPTGQEGGVLPAGLAPDWKPSGGDCLCQNPTARSVLCEGQPHRGK